MSHPHLSGDPQGDGAVRWRHLKSATVSPLRWTRRRGGSRTTGYTSNGLNQYTSISNPSGYDIMGAAATGAIVTVNTQATQRLGDYFRKELTASNGSGPAWEAVEVEVRVPGAGVGGGDIVVTENGNKYVPPAAESLSHDEDGNVLSDGRWEYTWDQESSRGFEGEMDKAFCVS